MTTQTPTWGQLWTVIAAVVALCLAVDVFFWSLADKRLDELGRIIAPFILKDPHANSND